MCKMIESEYKKWVVINEIFLKLSSDYPDINKVVANVLEIWLLGNYNNERDPFVNPDYDMVKDWLNKKDEVGNYKKILKFFIERPRKWNGKYDIVNENGVLRYGHFSIEIEPMRLDILKKQSLDKIMAMALRYASISLYGGNFLSMTANTYKSLIDIYGAELEGFASPLNSQFLMHGLKFCSLFLDTDGPFGSVGDFFKQKFKGCVVCNPPFYNSLIQRAVDYTNGFPDCVFIYCLPTWQKEKWYSDLENHKLRSDMRQYNEFTYNYQAGDKIVRANFATTIFVIGKHKPMLASINML